MATNFKIALTSVPFNNQYENVLRFDSRAAQYTYFDIPDIFDDASSVNFNVESMLYSSITFEADSSLTLSNMLQSNYAIVQDNSKTTPVYYFYFVTEAKQSSGRYLNLKLELDIFQTFYIDTTFAPSEMLRAHLNRFIEDPNDSTKVLFDGTESSLLFKREPLNAPAKILKSYTHLAPSPYSQSSLIPAVYNWIKNYLVGWQYLFIDSTQTYNYKDNAGSASQTGKFSACQYYIGSNYQNMYTNVSVLAFPIYKDQFGTHLIKKYNTSYYLDNASEGVKNYASLNNSTSYVFSTKFSLMPPSNDLSIDGDSLVIGEGGDSSISFINFGTSAFGHGLHVKSFTPDLDNIKADVSTGQTFSFSKSTIIGATKSTSYNPKLNSLDYKSLTISDTAGNKKEYDIQKLNTATAKLIYDEAITPDITRYQINLFGGLYKDGNDICYNGLIGSVDNSILYSNDSYASYLAANKNFYQQQQNQNIVSAVGSLTTGAFSTVLGVASGGAFGGLTQTGGLGGSIGQTIINQLNLEMTMDNLRNTPDEIKNSNGSVLFNITAKPLCLTAEYYEAIESELKIANDYMDLYGYAAAGIIGNPKSYDNIRKYHNYVQCNLGEVTGSSIISNEIERKFRDCFKKGVRFWNASNGHLYDYTVENYENWLED